MGDEVKTLIRGGGAIFLALTFGYVITFFSKLILSRYLGPSGFGLFEMLTTILGICSVLGGMALYSGINRFIPLYTAKEEYGKVKGYLRLVTILQIIGSFVVSVSLFFLAPTITAFFDFSSPFEDMLRVLSLTVPFYVFTKSLSTTFFAYKKALVGKAGTQVVESLVTLLGAVLLWYLSLDVYYTSFIFLASWGSTFLFYIYMYKQDPHLQEVEPDYSGVKRWMKYSIPLLVSGLIGFILNWTDNFVIGRYLSETELGVYGIAFSISFYIFSIPKLFTEIFVPVLTELYETDKSKFNKIFKQIQRWTLLFGSIIGIGFIAFSTEIITILFGQAYSGGGTALAILAGLFVVASYFHFYGRILILHDDTQYILYAQLLAITINLGLTIYLVNLLGITGAAIGSGFSYLFIRFLFYLRSRKHIKISLEPKKNIRNVVYVLGAMSTAYLTLHVLILPLNLPSLLYVGLGGIIYAGILLLIMKKTSMITQEDLVILEVIEEQTGIDLEKVKQWLQ